MKSLTIIVTCLFFAQPYGLFSQTVSGVVMDEESHEPISYVNMGILHKNFGTITNERGQYQLSFSISQLDDTLTLQHINYGTVHIPIRQLIRNKDIYLKEKVKTLEEIRITSQQLKQRKFGIRTHNPLLWGGLGIGENGISEIAQEIRTNKTLRLLDLNIFLRIYRDSLPLKYRIKFYTDKDGVPGELIRHANIVKEGLVPGWNKIDLTAYDILTRGDFFVSIEFLPVRNMEVPNIYAGAVLIGGNRYSRKVSLGTWEKSQGGYTLYVTGEY